MRHVMWGISGVAVVLYVFLAALGAFEPGEVVELTVAIVALSAALLVHEWRGQFRAEHFRH